MVIRITRVAASPIPAFPKGKEHHATTSNTAKWNSRPLGRAWGGAYTSSSNSVGVAISQPRVEACSASTLGIYIIRCSNAVSVALSRRRYPQQDIGQKCVGDYHKTEYNAFG